MIVLFLIWWLLTAAFEAVQEPLVPGIGVVEAARFDYCQSADANRDLLARAEISLGRTSPAMRADVMSRTRLAHEGVKLAESIPDREVCERVFREGSQIFSDALAGAAVDLRKGMSIQLADDKKIARVQLDLAGEWHFDESARHATDLVYSRAATPSTQWARSLADFRMRTVARNAAFVVSEAHHDFGSVDARRFGPETAWRAEQLAQRYGTAVSP